MKNFSKILLGLTCVGFSACGNSQQTSNNVVEDTTEVSTETVVETTEEPAEKTADFDQLEKTARMVFAMVLPQGENADDFEEIVVSKCTPSFIDALKQQNDFEDGSIAWWALRTMEQEGPEDSSIISVTADGNDAVIVEYSDMGHKATTRLAFVKDGEDYKVNSATVSYKGKIRTIK